MLLYSSRKVIWSRLVGVGNAMYGTTFLSFLFGFRHFILDKSTMEIFFLKDNPDNHAVQNSI